MSTLGELIQQRTFRARKHAFADLEQNGERTLKLMVETKSG
jgi:hypothetical protein